MENPEIALWGEYKIKRLLVDTAGGQRRPQAKKIPIFSRESGLTVLGTRSDLRNMGSRRK